MQYIENSLFTQVELQLGSMFKGVLSPVVGLAGLNALLFVSYGSIIRYFEYHDHNVTKPFQATLAEVYMAGFGAGVACFFFSTPTDLIKIKAQMSTTPKTTLDIVKQVFANNGIRGKDISQGYKGKNEFG